MRDPAASLRWLEEARTFLLAHGRLPPPLPGTWAAAPPDASLQAPPHLDSAAASTQQLVHESQDLPTYGSTHDGGAAEAGTYDAAGQEGVEGDYAEGGGSQYHHGQSQQGSGGAGEEDGQYPAEGPSAGMSVSCQRRPCLAPCTTLTGPHPPTHPSPPSFVSRTFLPTSRLPGLAVALPRGGACATGPRQCSSTRAPQWTRGGVCV